MAGMIYQGTIWNDIDDVHVAYVNDSLQNGVKSRALCYLQWALARTGDYAGPVDGTMRPTVQAALDACRGAQYDDGKGTYAPITGPTVSKAFLTALFADYLDTPTPKAVVA